METATDTVGSANPLVTFGKAIEALKEGKMVQRQGWNGKGMFIFMQVPSQVEIGIVPKMTSLPQSVKDEFVRRNARTTAEAGDAPHNHSTIRYKNQLCIVYPDNTIYGWVASPSDVLEEDWIIINN